MKKIQVVNLMNFIILTVQNSWFSLHSIEYLFKGTMVKKQ